MLKFRVLLQIATLICTVQCFQFASSLLSSRMTHNSFNALKTSERMRTSSSNFISSSTSSLKRSSLCMSSGIMEVQMPALSSTMKEGKIVSWAKRVGEKVSVGDVLLVVESDKADMDVEAFHDGFLSKILTQEGNSAKVGDTVAIIVEDKNDIGKSLPSSSSAGETVPAPVVAATTATTTVSPSIAETKSVVVEVKKESPVVGKNQNQENDRVAASGFAKSVAKAQCLDIKTAVSSREDGYITSHDLSSAEFVFPEGVINATPMAKKLALENNLDVTKLKGTGNFGRVTQDDVLIAAGKKTIPVIEKAAPPTSSTSSKTEIKKSSEIVSAAIDEIKTMDGMQKAVSKNMEKTLSIPVFRVSREIFTDNFDSLYAQLKPKGITVSAMLAKAVSEVLKKYPIINAAYTEVNGAPSIKFNKDINIAMAVAIDGGLITPTIQQAQNLDLFSFGRVWKELVDKAKNKKLSPAEYSSGTFTISNLGMFGVQQFDAILPPNTGSILAISSSLPKVVSLDNNGSNGGFAVKKSMIVTLTCDHRHIYGADAAAFLKDLAELLENNAFSLLMG